MRPLWRRIVTGQVIGWRIRLLVSRLLRIRRSAARRALAWLDRHPEFHDVLADEGPVAFARFTVASARTARTTRSIRPARPSRRTGYRPSVDAPADLDVTGLRGSVALAAVDLHQAAERERAAAPSSPNRSSRSASATRAPKATTPPIRLLDAVDTSIWNPKWFRPSPDPHAVQLADLPVGTHHVRSAHGLASPAALG